MIDKQQLQAAEIAVDVIDYIEKSVHRLHPDNSGKDPLIDKVVQIVFDHYHNKSYSNNHDWHYGKK